jgi:hypothetical protein
MFRLLAIHEANLQVVYPATAVAQRLFEKASASLPYFPNNN